MIRIDYIVAAMGMFVMLATSALAFRFWRIGKPLSRAFTFNLCGEFLASTVTTTFCVLQIKGILPTFASEWQDLMRVILFSGMFASSIHMGFVIFKIERGK